MLGPNDTEGTYEFATLADDGVKMGIVKNGQPRSDFIDSDGDHPTQMGCSSKSFPFTKTTRLPVELLYYQGPRYHIALVVMWRKLAPGAVQTKDTLCNQLGNNFFFDPDHNSTPQQPYKDLLSRGWKPLAKENFSIPGSDDTNTTQVAFNPCYQGTLPVITNVAMGEILFNDAFVFWNTDIPATTQVILIEVATGATTVTDVDGVLSLDHQLHLTGLKANTQYQLQAISVSAAMGRAISSPIQFKTP